MRRIRVLIVHTQPLARRRASLALAGDPLFVVVGTAPNGRIGAAKAAEKIRAILALWWRTWVASPATSIISTTALAGVAWRRLARVWES